MVRYTDLKMTVMREEVFIVFTVPRNRRHGMPHRTKQRSTKVK